MKIFKLVLLGLATALAVINFWAIDYQDLWAKESLWAYFRIIVALFLIILLVRILRKQSVEKRGRK